MNLDSLPTVLVDRDVMGAGLIELGVISRGFALFVLILLRVVQRLIRPARVSHRGGGGRGQ